MEGGELQARNFNLHRMVIKVWAGGRTVAQGELMVFILEPYGQLKTPKMLLQ